MRMLLVRCTTPRNWIALFALYKAWIGMCMCMDRWTNEVRVCEVVFSKSWCPFCKATKDLLNSFNAEYKAIELDQLGAPLTTPPTTIHPISNV